MKTWTRTGSCKHCGDCCKLLARNDFILRGPNYMDSNNWCKYLFNKDQKWYCEIRIAVDENDIEFIEMLPLRDKEYYEEECKDYPDPDRPAHVPPLHFLLPNCGFKIEENKNAITE